MIYVHRLRTLIALGELTFGGCWGLSEILKLPSLTPFEGLE